MVFVSSSKAFQVKVVRWLCGQGVLQKAPERRQWLVEQTLKQTFRLLKVKVSSVKGPRIVVDGIEKRPLINSYRMLFPKGAPTDTWDTLVHKKKT